MRQASPLAKALMFAAGESSTAVCSILAGWYAWQRGIPGGFVLFVAMIVFNAASTVMTAIVPRGAAQPARSRMGTRESCHILMCEMTSGRESPIRKTCNVRG